MKYSEMTEEQKERYRQYHRNYYQAHKQQHRERCEKWAKEHPDKVKANRHRYFQKYWEREKDRIMQRRRELHPRRLVEVVRCKNCRYREDPSAVISEWLPCQFGNTPDNWFCASGIKAIEAED